MKVVVFSGHMIDRADRPQARFPASKAASAKERIQTQLDLWQISALDRVISSAACGSDILFLEHHFWNTMFFSSVHIILYTKSHVPDFRTQEIVCPNIPGSIRSRGIENL